MTAQKQTMKKAHKPKKAPSLSKKEYARLEAEATEEGVLSSLLFTLNYADPARDYNAWPDNAPQVNPFDDTWFFSLLPPVPTAVFPTINEWPDNAQENFKQQFRIVRPLTYMVGGDAKEALIQLLLNPQNKYHPFLSDLFRRDVYAYYHERRYQVAKSMTGNGDGLVKIIRSESHQESVCDAALTENGVNALIERGLLSPSLRDMSIHLIQTTWAYCRSIDNGRMETEKINNTFNEADENTGNHKKNKNNMGKSLREVRHANMQRHLVSPETMLVSMFSERTTWIYPINIISPLSIASVYQVDHDAMLNRHKEIADQIADQIETIPKNARSFARAVLPLIEESDAIENMIKYAHTKKLESAGLVFIEEFGFVPTAHQKTKMCVNLTVNGLLWMIDNGVINHQMFEIFKPIVESRLNLYNALCAVLDHITHQFYEKENNLRLALQLKHLSSPPQDEQTRLDLQLQRVHAEMEAFVKEAMQQREETSNKT